jgi:hypothetical protein
MAITRIQITETHRGAWHGVQMEYPLQACSTLLVVCLLYALATTKAKA